MSFAIEKNIAIVWLAKSFLQLAFTVDDTGDNSLLKTTNKNDEQKVIFPIKMEQFQPMNEKQHFIFHSILPENHFHDAFFRIESLSHPGFFLDAFDESSNNDFINSVFLSHGSQNTKKWQFIDGQFRCNNGKKIIIFDESNSYSLKTTNIKDLNNIHENNFNFASYSKIYEEKIFHLCFYDGNSIPEQTPIIFYSPLYHKVITLITSGDLNSGGHWLRLEKYDPHMPSQVWVFNLSHQNDIRSSVVKEQAFDYYNDGKRYLLYTHVHHGRPNQQWDYTNYKLITHEADHLTVEYDDYLKELKMRKDIEMEMLQIGNNDNNNSIDISKYDIFGQSNVFLIFLSNQRTMINYSPDLDSSYLYNILINQKSFIKDKDNFDSIFSQRGDVPDKQYTWLSFDEFRGNIYDNYQNTSDYKKNYNIVTFKNRPGKTIKFRNVPISLNNEYNYYNQSRNNYYNSTKIENWIKYNRYLNDKISISSDQRIFINDVQLSENSSVTFSLIMKGKLLSDYKKKPSYNISNNGSNRNYSDFEDSFDVLSDEENENLVFINDNNQNNGNVRNAAGVNIRFDFIQHRITLKDEPKDWQPIKPRFPSSMDDIQVPNNEQNNNQVRHNAFIPPFLPFIGRRGFRRFNVNVVNNNDNNQNNNQNEQNDQNNDFDPNIKITYFDEKDISSNIDEQFKKLLNGSSITITKENSEQCRIIGYKLGITGMVEVANFVDSFSPQFAYLSDLSELQRELMEINESNIESLALSFSKHIQEFEYSAICWIILSVSITKPLQNDNLAKFCQILLTNQPPEFKEEFKKSIIRDFKSMHTNTFFYKKIYNYCQNLFSEEEMRNLLKFRYGRKNELIFFYNEFPELMTNLDELDRNELNHYIETGFNLNKLQKIIRDDDVDEFQKAFIAERISPNKHIDTNNLFERIPLLCDSPTLIQYAAFFGSIKIFKFLLLQQASLTNCDTAKKTTFAFAIAGGNTEIIHIIHQEQTKNKEFKLTTNILRNAIKFGQNDAFKWIFTNSSQEEINKIHKRDLLLEAILSKNINALLDLIEYVYTCESICVHFSALFDNLEFLKLLYPFYFDNKFSLVCDAAISGNVEILKYLLEKDDICLDRSLIKVAIRTAIKADNIEIFKYLASEKDYSYSNFIYACECNSLSFIKLFISNENSDSESFIPPFDFSNILINDCPLLFELTKKKSQDALEILLNSKYFDFKEKHDNHSLFYYAVSNELFDFALKLYNTKKKLYDINAENLLLENVKNSKIVQFLVSFQELNVNAQNDDFNTAIDILTDIITSKSSKEQSNLASINYLLDRPEIEFDPIRLLSYAIRTKSIKIFEKTIKLILSNSKHETTKENYSILLNDIMCNKEYDFYIKLIKSGLVSIDSNEVIQQCIHLSNPEIYHEVCNDQIPFEKVIQAFYYAIINEDEACFSYLLNITSIDFNRFNDYIPGTDQTMLTLAIKHAKNTAIVGQLLSNKFIDVNKPNKLGDSPLFISLGEKQHLKMYELILNHESIKFTFKEFEYAININKNEIFELMINHIDRFVDDPQKIVQIAVDKFIDKLSLLSFLTTKEVNLKFNFLPIILLYSVKNNLKSFYKSDLENKIDEIDLTIEDPAKKGATALCYAVYQRGMYFFNQLKNYHPLLINSNRMSDNRITPFGNVRSLEVANELIKLFKEKKVPTEIIVKEVCGLNVDGQTALYTSIVENNFILFEYLLKLNDELNQELKENKKEELIDALIYTKNEDGNNAFYAICVNNNWKLFINKLIEKVVQLNSKNDGYFGKFSPLAAAISARNFKLVDILLSKGFNLDHYSFCQILNSNLWNSLGAKLIESNPDFQFDLFMPLYLIQSEKTVEELFKQKRINYNFHQNEVTDDYLLLSAIRNRDEKLAELILTNCDKNYDNILFDWKDVHCKTALHYAIEKSMTKIVYLFIDIFTTTENNNNRFNIFFIEDKNSENSIHYLFKSFNEDYILYFYKHASSFLNSCNKIQQMKTIINEPTLLYKIVTKSNKKRDDDIIIEDHTSLLERLIDVNEILSGRAKYMITKQPEINNEICTKETLLTYAVKNNKNDFIKFILEKIPEIDPNVENSIGEIPLQLSISNPIIFKTIIESYNNNTSGRDVLDVNKNNVPFYVLLINDSKTASSCLNLLLQCQNLDINQKKKFKTSKKSPEKEAELSLLDLFIKTISKFNPETQKMFLDSPKVDFNSNPKSIFKLIESDHTISLPSVFSRISDEVIKNARTDDDEKDTIATFIAKRCTVSNTLITLVFDQRIDFVNSKNAKGKSAIDILHERGLESIADFILAFPKK